MSKKVVLQLLFFFLFSSIVSAKNLIVEFVYIKGEVNFKDGGVEQWYKAEVGTKITTGATIYTKVNSEAILSWGGGHAFKISQLSLVNLSKISFDENGNIEENKIDIEKGKALFKARKLISRDSKYEVKTPTAAAGVRGTEFNVEVFDNKATVIDILSGEVNVTAISLETFLDEGKRIIINPGRERESKPESIPEEKKIELQKESNEMKEYVKETTGEKVEGGELKVEAFKDGSKEGEIKEPVITEGAGAGEKIDVEEVSAGKDLGEEIIKNEINETKTMEVKKQVEEIIKESEKEEELPPFPPEVPK